jgi:hypothetical protein
MDKQIDCIRCRTRMEPGCVVNQCSMVTRGQWYPGEPESSFWMGLKLKKGMTGMVSTLRCPSCGYLESYAGG